MTSTTKWLAILLFLMVGCGGASRSVNTFPVADVTVGSEGLTVWVADESSERQKGLMEIEELPDGIDGILFAYSSPSSLTFQMLNTPMPLDIWWFDSTGILVGSAEMEPCESKPCTSYRSPGPIQWVLETPQDEYDFAPGTMISVAADSTIDSS